MKYLFAAAIVMYNLLSVNQVQLNSNSKRTNECKAITEKKKKKQQQNRTQNKTQSKVNEHILNA